MPDMNAIRICLNSLVTQYDAKEEAKAAKRKHGYHNIYALGIYLGRVDTVIADMATGSSLARALYDNFNDRLLTFLEKGCKLPVTYGGGAHDRGRPA